VRGVSLLTIVLFIFNLQIHLIQSKQGSRFRKEDRIAFTTRALLTPLSRYVLERLFLVHVLYHRMNHVSSHLQISEAEGVRGFYRGFGALLLTVVPANMCYFSYVILFDVVQVFYLRFPEFCNAM